MKYDLLTYSDSSTSETWDKNLQSMKFYTDTVFELNLSSIEAYQLCQLNSSFHF